MNLPDESLNTGHTSRKANIAVFMLLLVAVVGIAFLAYLESQDIDFRTVNPSEILGNIFSASPKENAVEIIKEIGYSSKEKAVFCAYEGYLIKCTNDGMVWIDKKGEEISSSHHMMNRPFVRTAGAYLLVADLGGKQINVFKGTDPLWSFYADSSIINVDISRDGYVTMVQEANGCKAGVSVFDPRADKPLIFTRTIAESLVLSARLLPSGKQLLINKIDTEGIRTGTYLEFNHLSSEEPYSSVYREDALYPAVWFMDDGSTFAAGDSKIIYLNQEGKAVWEQDYGNGAVFSSNVCLGKYPVVAVAGLNSQDNGGNAISVNIMNKKGDVIAGYPVNDEVSSIQTCSDIIAVNLEREVLFLNTRGKAMGRFAAGNKISGVFFLNKKTAAVVAKDGISLISIG